MRKLTIALGLTAAVLVSGIASMRAHAQEGTIPVIVKNTSSSYWRTLLAGARKAGKELNISVPELGPQQDSDIAGQIAILENAVTGNPMAVVIAASQAEALGKPIDEAATKTKVIGVDSGANTKSFTAFVATNNVEGGRAAGEALAQAIAAKYGKAEGEVFLMTSVPGSGSLDDRAAGFKAILAEKYPDIKIVADKVADGQITTGLNITNDVLLAFPNLRGAFASSEEMAIGVSQAVTENSAQAKVMVVAFDSNEQLVQSLSKGDVVALIVQSPFGMGYQAVKTAYAAAKGEKVEANVDTGVSVITKENMDTDESKALLNPKLD